jgi:DnaJ like chaperone protein
MRLWGKLLGVVAGWLIGGPIGALVGLLLGHQVDRLRADFSRGMPPGLGGLDQAQVRQVFFETTFSVMGRVAKADGRVSEAEIALARQVMAQMGLGEAARQQAIAWFSAGKQPEFDLDAALARFYRAAMLARNLRQMFIEIQLHAAYADGQLHEAERRLLLHICKLLHFSAADFARLEAMAQAARHAAGARAEQVTLEDAYAILDLAPQATDAEVKRAYRRLTSQHHPDKLAAKGLPDEMMKLAQEKTREIRAAYERIRAARGFS